MGILRYRICYMLVICALLEIISSKDDGLIVTIDDGKVRGRSMLLFNGARYCSFQGIPYAAPPVDELRFKPPKPAIPWEGVLDATKFGSPCTHYNITLHGDEDCLFVNVYSKSLRKTARLPVMFYIFGGAFAYGSGNYFYGDYLLQHDVVVVTFNYRLEILGFLNLEIPEVAGNAGLKDQVAAMRWVKNNIIHFGGDPTKVTIIGDSAAGASVTYHLLSPMSRGLFQQAIAQGGSCYNDWAQATRTIERAFTVAKTIGVEANDVYELYDNFMGLDNFELANKTQASINYDESYRGPPPQFVPSVEKMFENVDSFITENPVKMVEEGNVARIPLLIGYNNGEGILYLNKFRDNIDFYNEHKSFFVGKQIAETVSEEKLQEFGERIYKFYAGNKTLTKDDVYTIIDMVGDSFYIYNMHRYINAYARLGTKVYMYRFNLDTELNMVKGIYGLRDIKGVCHGDELWYIFKNFLNEHLYEESLEVRAIIYRITKMWTDFAKFGNPTPPTSVEQTWEPYTVAGKEYYNIDHTFSTQYYADRERIQFWDKIYRDAGLPYIGV